MQGGERLPKVGVGVGGGGSKSLKIFFKFLWEHTLRVDSFLKTY